MKQQQIRFSIAALVATMCAPAAHAVDVTAGDWKLSFDGNVNADYIYSNCESLDSAKTIGGGLTCVAPGDGQRSSSSVSNGLLPAALSISAATTQAGYDIGVTFGLYPGISTNDGGSPNLANTSATRNTALGSAGLDVRQVFLTFGNKEMGTVLAGRNIGLFGADAILNDMTLLGVGAGGSNAAPTNTSLGSIGYGYIYTDWLAQIDYTTPDMNGVKVTVGIFDPVESLTDGTGPTPKATPGFHGKVAFKNGGPLYLSASFLYEKQEFQRSDALGNLISGQKVSYDGTGFDFGGKYDIPGGIQVAAWAYYAKGLGTTGLFVYGADTNPASAGYGENRKSYGGLAQVTYKIPETNFKLGFNYGTSRLSRADNEVNNTLVKLNDKFTLGVYDQLTPNLLLLAEGTSMWSRNQVGDENKAWVANVGAFVSF
ncbi:MAG: porin [Proteobacteria bacterium]|nr:porin [Pseudomonadota bacterium]